MNKILEFLGYSGTSRLVFLDLQFLQAVASLVGFTILVLLLSNPTVLSDLMVLFWMPLSDLMVLFWMPNGI
jgi:hypothetical protein